MALDSGYAEAISRLQGARLIFSHPVYQYFQARYPIDGRSVHWEPEQPPNEQQLDKLGTLLKAFPAQTMIWEAPPVDEAVTKLNALGLTSIVVRPQAHISQDGDWLDVQRQNIRALGDLAR